MSDSEEVDIKVKFKPIKRKQIRKRVKEESDDDDNVGKVR